MLYANTLVITLFWYQIFQNFNEDIYNFACEKENEASSTDFTTLILLYFTQVYFANSVYFLT